MNESRSRLTRSERQQMARVSIRPKTFPCPVSLTHPRPTVERRSTSPPGNGPDDTKPLLISSLPDPDSSSTCQKRTQRSHSCSRVSAPREPRGTQAKSRNRSDRRHTSLLPSTSSGMSRLVRPGSHLLAGPSTEDHVTDPPSLAFDSTDKQGGFIGSMFVGGNNVAVDLVREG